MAHAYDLSGDPGLEPFQGTVYKKTIDRYDVQIDGRIVRCELATSLRKELAYTRAGPSSERRRVREAREDNHSDPVAVGDHVLVQETGDGTGLIRAVFPRRNQLSRRTAVPRPGAHAFEQVVAANLDQVAPVFAVAQPAPHWAMLDRYLASSELAGLPALIIITKIDLLAVDGQDDLDREIRMVASTYRQVGYPVLWVSAASGEGLPELATALHGKVTALVGKSGVGKTTLLNALQPGLGRRVSEVSQATGKGRHTTSWLELIPLSAGGAIVDTPGMREVGLWDVDQARLDWLFPEMRPWIGKCRFGLDCIHDQEPGCAVRHAVMAGAIAPRRYQSYLKLREGQG